MSEKRLTRSLLELFGCQSEYGKQLNHYLNDYLIHCGCWRDPCIYNESMKKVFDRLEQVDECIQVGCHILSRLDYMGVIGIHSRSLENGTYSK